MDEFRDFKLLRTNDLQVIRDGFFRPQYKITDGQFWYGSLGFAGTFSRFRVFEIATGTWTLKRKTFFSRTLFIYNPQDECVGSVASEIWSGKVTVSMNSGLEASFFTRGFLKKSFVWYNNAYGEMMVIKQQTFGFNTPFNISLDVNLVNRVPDTPLLIFLGVNFILIRRRKAAFAAAH